MLLAHPANALAMAAFLAAMATGVSSQEITFQAGGLSREQALAILLKGTGTSVSFSDEILALAPVAGSRHGTTEELAEWLLSGTSYITIRDGVEEALSRIIVTGSKSGSMPRQKRSIGTPGTENQAAIEARRIKARHLFFSHLKASAETVRKRLAELPPGNHIIRTQAVRFTPSPAPGQSGNVPLFVGKRLYP